MTIGPIEDDAQTVMDLVREHLGRRRFSIERYDRIHGEIWARRNDPTLLLLGLYRNVRVRVAGDVSNGGTLLRMRWGGALTASSITFAEFTLISLFLLHHHGFEGTLLSILIGLIMALINNLHYLWMMRSFSSALNEDLNSLEPSHHFAATDAEPNGDVKDGQRDATS